MSRVVRAAAGAVAVLAMVLATALAAGCELGEPVEPEPVAVLPDDWPAEFPDPPPGARLRAVTHLAPDDNPGVFAHMEDADVRNYYVVNYDIDEDDIVELFTYYREAFGAAGWHDLEIADDPTTIVVSQTGFTFRGYGARGHVLLVTDFTPAGIQIDMQVLR